jgi:hypothetical protein
MNPQSTELKERISKLSDEDLLKMVNVDSAQYRQEALDHARDELAKRGVQDSAIEPFETHEPIQCKFCGQLLDATATECSRCGAGTPYGVALDDVEQQLEFAVDRSLQRYEYRMVQIPPSITVKRAFGNEAAVYLQTIVNEQASQGWEFMRVDTIGIHVPAGCLASLFGGQSTTLQYYVVTFRRDVQLLSSA